MPHATAAEYASYQLDQTLLQDADLPRQLQRASDEVDAILGTDYDATDSDHVAAVRDATCALTEAIRLMEAAGTGGEISEYRLGEMTVKYTGNQTGGQYQAAVARARRYLARKGLLHRKVYS